MLGFRFFFQFETLHTHVGLLLPGALLPGRTNCGISPQPHAKRLPGWSGRHVRQRPRGTPPRQTRFAGIDWSRGTVIVCWQCIGVRFAHGRPWHTASTCSACTLEDLSKLTLVSRSPPLPSFRPSVSVARRPPSSRVPATSTVPPCSVGRSTRSPLLPLARSPPSTASRRGYGSIAWRGNGEGAEGVVREWVLRT